MAAALSSLNRTVLWRVSDGELPPGLTLSALGLPPAVHTLPWAPQNALLAHPLLACFVSHGGTNGWVGMCGEGGSRGWVFGWAA